MVSRHRLQAGLLCFILFIAGAFYIKSNHEFAISQRAMTEVSEGVEQGEKAISFSLQSTEGEEVSLDDFDGEKVFMFFFTTWCQVCSEQWEQLEIAQKEGFIDNINIIAVNLSKEERKKSDVGEYVKYIMLENANVLLDGAGHVQDLYHVFGIPTGLLINEAGVIEKRFHNLVSVEDIVNDNFFK
ncbi:peroxiredoxin family protein [Evansella sp. AB-rgal1]|uniref:peroxiredoxin family protein n=1 Tax=Evansella sp. AB-rgal1 TaxID=3242696 RepID=UPI00359E946C